MISGDVNERSKEGQRVSSEKKPGELEGFAVKNEAKLSSCKPHPSIISLFQAGSVGLGPHRLTGGQLGSVPSWNLGSSSKLMWVLADSVPYVIRWRPLVPRELCSFLPCGLPRDSSHDSSCFFEASRKVYLLSPLKQS